MSFQFRCELPKVGSMTIELTYEEQHIQFITSYVHPQSIDELIACLVNILSGNSNTSMYWELEPNQMWFEFGTENSLTTFEAKLLVPKTHPPKIQLTVILDNVELCKIFWRGLRYLQTNSEAFKEGWRYPFPDEAMNRFTEQLEAARKDTET